MKSPTVCVVTRTKDRALLLTRAARSIGNQTYQDYIWVVVNDGGDPDPVQKVIDAAPVARERVKLTHNAQSMGMEAASNIGIRQTDSQYLVIHDDDDSWEPDFLAKTVAFLDGPEGERYGGVVTYSTYVSELIRDEEVVELSRTPYQDKLTGVDLDAIIDRNLYPPISFLFRRSVHDQIGGFDETLPVLGDWLFNMEFLLRANVGVLPELLALYHHRDRSDLTRPEYRNTVVDQLAVHQKYTSLVRNSFLRRNLNQSAVSFRLALQGAPNLAPENSVPPPRTGSVALPSAGTPVRGQGDLLWTISAINAKLADRTPLAALRHRGLRPIPPNAPWSVALPALRKLRMAVPPPHDFDEIAYLRANPDVAAEVRKGNQGSGFTHYILHGRHEGRLRPTGEYMPEQNDPDAGRTENSGQLQDPLRPVFDSPMMLRNSHKAPGFERVLHIAHHEWHGIRQATAYCPGHKLLISAHEPIEDAVKQQIASHISRMKIDRVCIQGYSENADSLLLYLRSALGPATRFYMISHVTTAQFDHRFEMVVIGKLLSRLKFGLLDGIASVKPHFGEAIEGFWPGTILNYAPKVPLPKGRRSSRTEVYAPLDIGWRKNLYTNIMAASLAQNVEIVKTANFPSGLEDIQDIGKLRLVGYLRGKDLLDEMARSSLTLVATLAECQPMTQLESFAVGTPALTGPLQLSQFADDPLIKLCTTCNLDNPALLARDIENIVEVLKRDPTGMEQMILSHLDLRHRAATLSYAEFMGL